MFSHLYWADHEYMGSGLAEVRRRVEAEYHRPENRLYLAEIEGQSAAVARLVTHLGIGYFGATATLPQFHEQGCQAALLTQRSYWTYPGLGKKLS